MATEVTARELVEQIWAEVEAERALRPEPQAGLGSYDRLLEDGERHYINSRYVLNRSPRDDAGASSGRLPLRLRARAARFVVHVLGGYFADEEEFLAHLVRLQNRITVEIDRLGEEVRQVEELVRAESDRLRSADTVLHTRLEERVQALEEELAAVRVQRPVDPGS